MQRLLGELRTEWGLPSRSPEAGAACAPGRVGVSGLGLGRGLSMRVSASRHGRAEWVDVGCCSALGKLR
jgi:hypothetical protein